MTLKDAETAFMNMLSEIGVDEKWNWEQVMRETITLPMYKVYKTSAERKATFEKYVQQLLDDEKETMALSVERGKKAWNSAMDKLNGGPDKEGGVKIWWNWEMRKEELKTRIPDAWDNLRNDDERRILFDDYLAALKRKQAVRFLCFFLCQLSLNLVYFRLVQKNFELRISANLRGFYKHSHSIWLDQLDGKMLKKLLLQRKNGRRILSYN